MPQTLTDTLPLQGIPTFDENPEMDTRAYDHAPEKNAALIRDSPETMTLIEAGIMPGPILQTTLENDVQEVWEKAVRNDAAAWRESVEGWTA